MRIHEQIFSAQVELPCKIFCGPHSLLEFAGTAVNIGPASIRLHMDKLFGAWQPVVGEQLRLELVMPVNMDQAKAKYLSVRATVADVDEQPDGTRWLELRFRKPTFKDRMDENTAAEPAKAASAKWKM
jgi:hypothetical protein